MKYKCAKCQKTIDENQAIKMGWFYFCSEKCLRDFKKQFKYLWYVLGVMFVAMIISFIWLMLLLFGLID